MKRSLPVVALLSLLSGGPVRAESHAVTVQNGTAETIRSIVISPSAGSGENRLRSTLPSGAVGRLTYSTGCRANVRIGYEGGRTEDHADVDVCSDPRIVAGTDGVAGPAGAPLQKAAAVSTVKGKPGASPVPQVVVAPRPVVPPWTGRSITKRFGGME